MPTALRIGVLGAVFCLNVSLSFAGMTAAELVHLGNVNGRQDNYTGAIVYYSKAIAVDPHLANAYYNRGYAFIKKKKYKLAKMDFDKAIDIEPHYAAAFHLRGVVHFYQKYYKKAVDDYSTAIKFEPDNVKYYFSRLSAYCKLGLSDRAWEDVIHIQKLGGHVNPTLINILKAKPYRNQE
jgi:tetratricopeptide (TPR) repeat protein